MMQKNQLLLAYFFQFYTDKTEWQLGKLKKMSEVLEKTNYHTYFLTKSNGY